MHSMHETLCQSAVSIGENPFTKTVAITGCATFKIHLPL